MKNDLSLPRTPKTPPRRTQDDPKRPPSRPKTPQVASKTRQDAPRTSQDSPKPLQSLIEKHMLTSRGRFFKKHRKTNEKSMIFRSQDAPKRPQDDPKTPPRRPQAAPGNLQDVILMVWASKMEAILIVSRMDFL